MEAAVALLQNIVKEGLTRKIFRYKDLASRSDNWAPKRLLAEHLAVRICTEASYPCRWPRSVIFVTRKEIILRGEPADAVENSTVRKSKSDAKPTQPHAVCVIANKWGSFRLSRFFNESDWCMRFESDLVHATEALRAGRGT